MVRGQVRSYCVAIAFAALGIVADASPALAQTVTPETAPVQLEWLALAPVVRLMNVGWDDNVFHVSEDRGPIRDFTATFSPSVDAWLSLPRSRVVGRSQVDFVYFKELSNIRSIDTDNSGQIDLRFGRLTPFAGATWTNARHRWTYEIDAPIRRIDASWTAGVDVFVSKKTSLGVVTRRSSVDYEEGAVYDGTVLEHLLNANSTSYAGRVRYEVTPLTTVGFEVGQYESDFESADRNSKGSRISSIVEFKPRALISGRAVIGFVSREFVDRAIPEYRGVSSRVDLAYTLLGRTRFDVTAQRDLSASYKAEYRDYVQVGAQLSVVHRLASAWDVQATVGRFTLDYTPGGTIEALDAFASERIMIYGSGVGYHVGRTRIGIEFARQQRDSDFAGGRGYERNRVSSSFMYVF